MQLSRPLLTSILINIACISGVLGIIGFFNLIVLSDSDLPVLTAFGSFPGLVFSAGVIAFIFRKQKLVRLAGFILVAYSLLLWFGQLHLVSQQFYQPPFAMVVNLFLVGATLATYRLGRLYKYIGGIAVVFGLCTGLSAMVGIWFRYSTLTSAVNVFELSVFALKILLIATGICIAYFLEGYDTKVMLRRIWLPIITIQLVTVGFWVYLSANQIEELYQRGNISIQQTGEAIDEALVHNQGVIARFAARLDASETDSEALEIAISDALRISDDYKVIDSVILLQSETLLWKEESKSGEEYEYILTAPYRHWLSSLSNEIGVAIDLRAQDPKVILASRLPGFSQPTFALFHFDIKMAMTTLQNSYFDVFTQVLEVSEGVYVSANSEYASINDARAIIESSSVVIRNSYMAVTGYPTTLFAVLTDLSVLINAVKLHLLLLFAGFIFSIVLTFALISNYKLRQQKHRLNELAIHDSVTGLYRRAFLEEHIQSTIEVSDLGGWILFIDLDGFKPINDSLGINIGNKVLNVIAQRLLFTKPETAAVARFSSDEFIIYVAYADDFNVQNYCEQLLNDVRQKIVIEGFSLHLTASIGVYQLEKNISSASEAIQRADVSMSTAKASGGNIFRFYNAGMAKHYEQAMTIRNELQEALDEELLDVFYQPIVCAVSGKIESVEALIRWCKSDGSFVSPGLFIPIAEQTGQIIQLSQFMLYKAMTDIGPLADIYGINLSVNLSIQQFQQADVVANVKATLNKTGFEASRLCVELTESVLINDIKFIREQLTLLRNIGVKVAIDDFGTGYSSLSYLSKLPVDILKIDKSFTQEVKGKRWHLPSGGLGDIPCPVTGKIDCCRGNRDRDSATILCSAAMSVFARL